MWMYKEMKKAGLPLKNLPPSDRNLAGAGTVHKSYDDWKLTSHRIRVWFDDLMSRKTRRHEYSPPCEEDTLQ